MREQRERAKEREQTRKGSPELWEVVVVLIVVISLETPTAEKKDYIHKQYPFYFSRPRHPSARSTGQIQWPVPYHNPHNPAIQQLGCWL
jgi:hypothetical protein